MNFFNIGPGELFLVLVMALVVFGPQRLPEIARKIGQGVNDLRNMVNNLDPELLEDWREVTHDLDTVRDEMRHIRSDVVELQRDLKGAANEVTSSVDEAVKDAATTVDDTIHETGAARKTATASAASPTQAKPATAGATSNATGTAATTTAAKPATGPGERTVSPRPAPVTPHRTPAGKPTVSGAAAAAASPESADEIIGTLLTRGDDGTWQSLNEVVGVKVFPTWRRAPRPTHNGNGDGLEFIAASREARMAHLASARPTATRGRPAPGVARLNPRPRPVVAARLERVKRG